MAHWRISCGDEHNVIGGMVDNVIYKHSMLHTAGSSFKKNHAIGVFKSQV